MSNHDKEPQPEPDVKATTQEDNARLPESYAQEDDEEDEYEPTLDDTWGDDDEELTEEEWEEAAERQAARAAEDPAYARMLRMLLDSPAMRPAVPRRLDDDEDDEE